MTGGVQCPKQTPRGGGGQSGLLSSFYRKEFTPLSPPRPPLLPLSLSSLCSRCTGLRAAPPAHPVWFCPRAFAHVRQYPDHHPYEALSLTLFGSGPRCHFLGDLVLKYPPSLSYMPPKPLFKAGHCLHPHGKHCSSQCSGLSAWVHSSPTASSLGGEAPLPASFCRWEHGGIKQRKSPAQVHTGLPRWQQW